MIVLLIFIQKRTLRLSCSFLYFPFLWLLFLGYCPLPFRWKTTFVKTNGEFRLLAASTMTPFPCRSSVCVAMHVDTHYNSLVSCLQFLAFVCRFCSRNEIKSIFFIIYKCAGTKPTNEAASMEILSGVVSAEL